MKISCPSCGKTYTLPPDLIDHIIKDHESKRPAAGQPDRPQHRMPLVKFSMLVATVVWPIAIITMSRMFYVATLNNSVITDHFFILNKGAGAAVTPEHVLTEAIITGLVSATVLWAMVMAFLGAIWFAIRR